MFIDRLINRGPTPALEQMLRFTEARQGLIGENIANATTPGYRQKDLSTQGFQEMLREHVQRQESAAPGSVDFDDIKTEVENPRNGILFHDGNNRSMEQLMTDNAKNALLHNMVVELLRQQYQTMQLALREKVS